MKARDLKKILNEWPDDAEVNVTVALKEPRGRTKYISACKLEYYHWWDNWGSLDFIEK